MDVGFLGRLRISLISNWNMGLDLHTDSDFNSHISLHFP